MKFDRQDDIHHPLTFTFIASVMARYRYRPLDSSTNEIRVLHLQPGSGHDPVYVMV
jgi:hypothetical protein